LVPALAKAVDGVLPLAEQSRERGVDHLAKGEARIQNLWPQVFGVNVLAEEAVLARGGFWDGQGIMIDPITGCFWGGSDRRKDGAAIGF
jgi:hypothetical protein